MKFILNLKDPDGIADSVCEAAVQMTEGLELLPRELDDLRERRGDEIFEKLKKWVRDGEYLQVEIDLIAGTATVLEVKA